MLLCKSHCEVWHCMSLHGDPNRCSRIELALEDRDMQEGRVCERDIDGGVQFFLRCCITQPAGLVCCLLRW
ncbi:unnamed protein product [Gadus morhua 'NCC']